MSDFMRLVPFGQLVTHALQEYHRYGSIYNVKKIYRCPSDKTVEIFGSKLEIPYGPAAGPHTQLAQNLLATYAGGGRFFELKTVQTLDGTNLHIDKPCIRAQDECYNVEWSTELFVEQALEEYIKGWFALKLLSKELGLGDPNAFIFNMSVGYDLKGIMSEKIDNFIEGLKDASKTEVWKACKEWTLAHLDCFEHIDAAYVESISPKVCSSITLSTMHGCPAHEIEKIATYLLESKKLHTYIKCNPTLLGYEVARKLMDDLGFDYLDFDDHHFKEDLQFEAAVPMIQNLIQKAQSLGLTFGVKLTNTFPTRISHHELPGKEMYMSGKSLFPLSIHVAEKLTRAFDGKLPMSFSGGADKNNIDALFEAGIWPITVATILLKPQGLDVSAALAEKLYACNYPQDRCNDPQKIQVLALKSETDPNHSKTPAMRKKFDAITTYEPDRDPCLHCRVLCGNCVKVCPNRANEVIEVDGKKMILHIDGHCNECGNCHVFCVQPCAPYWDRWTLFPNAEDFANSKNAGFLPLGSGAYRIRLDGEEKEDKLQNLPEEAQAYIRATEEQLPYYFN